MVPLYILGLLLRFGPQHGYRIKKLIETELADFTQIKLPNIYYHLEKMEAMDLIASNTEQNELHTGKKVYHVTKKGSAEFRSLLQNELHIGYRPVFESDALFYFSDTLDQRELTDALEKYLAHLEKITAHIEEHKDTALSLLPEDAKSSADIIFKHHLLHYRAETAWAKDALKTITDKENSQCQNQE
ncbi:MAG TPA: PadR family transcriptional regulator, partial [Lachnospiraceae bacterium]|nr:PadR family transcriptional regulator [Lachnospiraceae bacterium]